jgi:uncharacterized membrane protein YkvA (DUF1232 family)
VIAGFRQRVRVYRAVARHPRTPRHAKVLLGAALAYALSPVDLIPDWIPVVGYLDDAVIVPGLVWLAMRSVPREVYAECRAQVRGDAGETDSPQAPD